MWPIVTSAGATVRGTEDVRRVGSPRAMVKGKNRCERPIKVGSGKRGSEKLRRVSSPTTCRGQGVREIRRYRGGCWAFASGGRCECDECED